MAGFLQDPISIINLISDNLRDRYSRFQVLKEIIQNADDAGKGNLNIHLEYGFINGLPGAEHPLLRGPALFFLNDGTFSDSDEKAIRSFGLNQKANDEVSIGKFGLGMKSVFHFCEAFFFLAQDNSKSYSNILNPWSGSDDFKSVHEDWEDFTKGDAELIRNHLTRVFDELEENRESYFLIWLPLRMRKHLQVDGSKVGSIISEFPGDNVRQLAFLNDNILPQKLAALLPLLRSLESIRYWHEQETGELKPAFHIHLKDYSARIKGFEAESRNSSFSGEVEYTIDNNRPFSQLYHGRESYLLSESLSLLKKSHLWPKSYFRDVNGISQEAPDKAKPHCAVFFSRSPVIQKSELRLRWAVFLPVKAGEENIACKGDVSFRLFLHGYFFVDAGRTVIDGLQDNLSSINFDGQPVNEAELRRNWNIYLVEKGILPLILPALNRFVEDAKLFFPEINNLCSAFKETKLFREKRKIICNSFQWLCTITPVKQEWKIVPREKKILPLPAPPKSAPERPWLTFTRLKHLQSEITFISTDGPHLLYSSIPQWSEADLEAFLDLDVAKNFNDQGRLDYVLAFLFSDGVKPFLNLLSLQKKLQQIIRQSFIDFGDNLRQYRLKIRQYVSLVHPEKRYLINNVDAKIFCSLQQVETNCLILSYHFDAPENPGKANLSYEDSLKLFRQLHELIIKYSHSEEKEIITSCRGIIRGMLQSANEDDRSKLLHGPASSLKILEGHDCQSGASVALSAEEIRKCMNDGLLFIYSQGINNQQKHGLGPKLQRVVEGRVLLIRSETGRLLFGSDNSLLPCYPNSTLDCLGSRKQRFQAIENRQCLLADVAGANLLTEQRVRGLRYLLHGVEDRFYDSSTLWVSGHEQSTVWIKLWQQVNGNEEDDWNLLERELVGKIPSDKWSELSIREIKPEGILGELRSRGTGFLTGDFFSRDECDIVLRELISDEQLWKELPFHETVKGCLVSVTEKSYLKTDIYLPDELYDYVNIIELSDDFTISRQQRDWLIPFSKQEVIKTALQHDQAVNFWQLVMDNLERPNAGSDLNHLLRNTAWIPDVDYNPVKPSEVIYLKSMQDEVDRLLAVASDAFWSPGKLHNEVQNHPSFAMLKEFYFASAQDGLEKLGLLLGETGKYHVGNLDQRGDLKHIIAICSRIPLSHNLPGWTLLYNASKAYSLDMIEEYLLPEILKAIGKVKIINILNWLQDEYVGTDQKEKKNVLICFNTYLSALVKEGGCKQDLSRLCLLNREENWNPANELCSEVQGVSGSFLLDISQKQILSNIIFSGDQYSSDNSIQLNTRIEGIKESAQHLKQYFTSWEGLVAPETISAFIALLGDDKGIYSLAEQYQGRHSVAWLRNEMPWNTSDYWSMSKQEAFAKHRVAVKIHDDTVVKTYSILGGKIEIPVSKKLDSLIINNVFRISLGRYRVSKFNLRKFNPGEKTSTELTTLLKSSAEIILKGAFNQKNYDLDLLWQELDKSEQLDIQVAQSLILNHIPFYLRQLGVHKHTQLLSLLHQWHDACCRQEEYSNSPNKKIEYGDEKRRLLQKIRNLLTNDKEVQKKVLNAVRAKILDYQYTTASIPFELFQNADDSMAELEEIKSHPNSSTEINQNIVPRNVKRFLILNNGKLITFIHWGRAVNAVGGAGFPGRKKGFHYDLEKMLILSSSDKSENNNVTGKLGLGFKSVLLASDKPKLISGRLSVEIIAGLFPMLLRDSGGLRQKLHKHSSDKQYQGTLIEMPLTEATSKDVMAFFPDLAGIMTIFAKQIRQIDIHGEQSKSWEWIPDIIPLLDTICLEIGELSLPNSPRQKELLLYFKIDKSGVLVAVGPEGFRSLPKELPAIWVVAPTQESKGLGFAINGPFELDAGRARLSGSSDINYERTGILGRSFGRLLSELYKLTQDQKKWEDLKGRFRFENDLTIYTFWASLWEVMGKGFSFRGSDEIGRIVTHLLCEESGIGHLLKHSDAMPNGLWGEYQLLTRPEKVKVIIHGCLDSESVFRGLSKWEPLKIILAETDSVISSQTYNIARKIAPDMAQVTNQWRSIHLVDLLNEFVLTSQILLPDAATTLGKVLNHESLKRDEFEKEREQIIKTLRKFSFKARDGSRHPASKLLVQQKHGQDNPDEAKRATFAPDKYILSQEYQGTALDLFFICREKISIPVDEMPTWILNAPTDTKKAKGLRYLLEGEHAVITGKALRVLGLHGTWLANLSPKSMIFADWSDDDRDSLIFRVLKSTEEIRHQFEFSDEDDYSLLVNELRRYDPEEVLQKIYRWWSANKNRYISEYERKTYPAAIPFDLTEDDTGRIDRKSWLTLFSLSHFHTIGRQQGVQHKGFIDNCIRKGWWDTFSKERPDENSDAWMRVLEEYINEQVDTSEYELWMNHFPTIYKFARRMEDYKEAFLSIERMDNLDTIAGILKPKTNPQFQGGGVDAPPIEKSLGIGACFTLRELKRKKVLNNGQVIPYCYVPTQSIRELCSHLGCRDITENGGIDNSKKIHRFLCDHLSEQQATFSNCFDIPLQCLRKDNDLILHKEILN